MELTDIYSNAPENTKEEVLYTFLSAYCYPSLEEDDDAIIEFVQTNPGRTLLLKQAIASFLADVDFSEEEKINFIYKTSFGFCRKREAIKWLDSVRIKIDKYTSFEN